MIGLLMHLFGSVQQDLVFRGSTYDWTRVRSTTGIARMHHLTIGRSDRDAVVVFSGNSRSSAKLSPEVRWLEVSPL
jgi:hypothetical protein